MTLPLWPASFPQMPLRDGLRVKAHAAHRRTPMEKGNSRLRAITVSSPAEVELRWRFPAARFNDFKLFYDEKLARGANWFTVPLWFGGAGVSVAAQFADRYSFAPRAAFAVTVSASLRVRQLPYVALEEGELEGFFDAEGRPVWPVSLPEGPLRTGLDIDPHRPVLTTDIDEGPKAKRDLFGPSPAEQPVQWSMSSAQFETFKAFHAEALAHGQRWFLAPLWFGLSLDRVAVRFREPFEFSPRFATQVLVSAQIEVRRMPAFAPPSFWGVPPFELAGESAPAATIEIEIATAL